MAANLNPITKCSRGLCHGEPCVKHADLCMKLAGGRGDVRDEAGRQMNGDSGLHPTPLIRNKRNDQNYFFTHQLMEETTRTAE